MYSFDAEKTTEELIAWIRDWFAPFGDSCSAVIGISGGKDSSVAAAACARALGRDRVVGVRMPRHEQADIADSMEVCDHTGIKAITVDIGDSVDALLKSIDAAKGLDAGGNLFEEISNQTKINISPRIRMTTLYAVAQSCNGFVANTCNLSESYIGYATLYGDQSGSFSPLDRLTVQEVIAIGDVLGVPYHLTHKAPSDGLCGKTDEDNIGFTYAELDRYIRTGEVSSQELKDKIDRKYRQNAFKLKLMTLPTFDPGLPIVPEFAGWTKSN